MGLISRVSSRTYRFKMSRCRDTIAMESRTTANYFVDDNPTWIAYSIGTTITHEILHKFKNCVAFSKRDYTTELREIGWSSIDAFDNKFNVAGKVHKLVKLNFKDGDGKELLKLIFIPDLCGPGNIYPLVFMPRPDKWDHRCPEYKRLNYFYTILTMHYRTVIKPLSLRPECLKSMLLKEYVVGMDDIELHAADPSTNISIKINFPDTSILDDEPNIDLLLSNAIKRTLSLNCPVPRIVGFQIEMMDIVYDKDLDCSYLRIRKDDNKLIEPRMAGIFKDLVAGKVN